MIINKTDAVIANKTLPPFTYTGNYTVVDDGDSGWRIKFLTSGTLVMLQRRTIDVFCVGGGSSGSYGIYKPGSTSPSVNITPGVGGAGGYTKTAKNIEATAGKPYAIFIGAGGGAVGGASTRLNGHNGGSSSAFGIIAAGGVAVTITSDEFPQDYYAGNGGSGGGGTAYLLSGDSGFGGAKGGSNGGNGYRHVNNPSGSGYIEQIVPNTMAFSQGQHSTTREFGEANGTLYSGGGGGGGGRFVEDGETITKAPGAGGAGGGGRGAHYNASASAGTANTGGGGGGGCYSTTSSYRHASGAGGSGIVVIRNHR